MSKVGGQRGALCVLAIAALVAATQCSSRHQYRATAVLTVVLPPGVSPPGPQVQLIPNATTSPNPVVDMLVRGTQGPDTATAVMAAGGAAHFTVAPDSDANFMDVAAQSTRRDQATQTVRILVDLLEQRLARMQAAAGASPHQSLTIAVVTEKSA